MKKSILAAAAVAIFGAANANAQAVEQPSFFDNVQIGVEGGVTTPMHNYPFFGDMRGAAGLHISKQLTPVVGVGVEGMFGVNTSSWYGPKSSTAFDNSYVGVYGTADLFNLFGGYNCSKRPFSIEALVGAGWGHNYVNEAAGKDINYMGVKTGLNFNFNVSDHVTLALKPSIIWNMGGGYSRDLNFNVNQATVNVMAGVAYTIGDGFKCVVPYNQAEVDALNAQVNALRADLNASMALAATSQAQADALATQLQACQNQAPKVQVVKEVDNKYNSVRFVFFRIGSSAVTADQRPNVEMIADYMKNHPTSKVVIKGYASKDGNYDFNVKLAKNRAESVKNMLVNNYKIPASRITAEGEGIGNMFEEESWNRVAICTLEAE